MFEKKNSKVITSILIALLVCMTFTVLKIPSVHATTYFSFGLATSGSSGWHFGSPEIVGSNFTAPYSGNVDNMSVWVDTPGNVTFYFAVYNSSYGLVGKSVNGSAGSFGLYTLAMNGSCQVISGTQYYLAFLTHGATTDSGNIQNSGLNYDSTSQQDCFLVDYTTLGISWPTIPTSFSPNQHYNDQFCISANGTVIIDTTSPTYSNLASSTDQAGQPCNFTVALADETALANYTFGTNNTGTWVNDTVVNISGTSYLANATHILNSTVGVKVSWELWFADSSNNLNNTGIHTLTTTSGDTTPPTFGTITASNNLAGNSTQISCTISDNIAVSSWGFAWNNTGSCANASKIAVSGTPITALYNGTWNGTAGYKVWVQFWANDTSNNPAYSSVQTFTLTSYGIQPIARVNDYGSGHEYDYNPYPNYTGQQYVLITMNATPTSGNILVAIIGYDTAPPGYYNSLITETGVTWTQEIVSEHGQDDNLIICVGVIGSGASPNINVSLVSAASLQCMTVDIWEYSGIATSNFLDQNATNHGSGTGPPCPTDTGTTSTTTQANELWVGGICAEGTQTTPTNGFNLFDGVYVDTVSLGYLDKIVSSNGTANSGTTTSMEYNWAGAIITLFGSTTTTSYTINATSDLGSTISPSGLVNVTIGYNQAFTISAISGYTISQVTVDGVSQGVITSYTFTNVQTIHTISVVSVLLTSLGHTTQGSNTLIGAYTAWLVLVGSNFTSTVNRTVYQMGFYAIVGNPMNFSLAIYDTSYNRLGYTQLAQATSSGVWTEPLVSNVTITIGTQYIFRTLFQLYSHRNRTSHIISNGKLEHNHHTLHCDRSSGLWNNPKENS